MVKLEWRTDSEGDETFWVDDNYCGLVCPHEERFIKPVAIFNGEFKAAETVADAKAWMEQKARGA